MTGASPAEVIIERCLAAAASCLEQNYIESAVAAMKAEFVEAARVSRHRDLPREEIVRLYLEPMRRSLAESYAVEEATQIYWHYLDAFWPRSKRPSPVGEALKAPTLPAWYVRHLAMIFASPRPEPDPSKKPENRSNR
jgi:hypothetical protein